eukprot:comp22041_c0_seq1/m.32009 comp22041_c0_seq1/g.32009  ORF comp22041_c0_seq1/g.32009 comp22041_c0_seq1/m.32009 type:complete len:496 (-) comp22041_c0_seq1:197-1684(-)
MSGRQAQYKRGAAQSAAQLREKKREQLADLRKQNRDKVLSRKRLRHDEDAPPVEEVEGELSQETVAAMAKQVVTTANDLKHRRPGKTLEPLRELRRLLARHPAMADAFLGVPDSVQLLMDLLVVQEADVQLEALWSVTNITAGQSHHTQSVLPTAPLLIGYLSGTSTQHQDLSAWALGNMAADGPETRDVLRAQGVLPPLVSLLRSSVTPPNVVEAVSFALSNLARGNNADLDEFVQLQCVPAILLQWERCVSLAGGHGVVSELCWLLTYLTARNTKLCTDLVERGVLPMLLDLLAAAGSYDSPSQAQTPILRVLGNLLSGDDHVATLALSMPTFLPALTAALQSPHRYVRSEAMWVLANITAGAPEHAQAAAREGLSQYAVAALDEDPVVVEQALYVLCNFADHGPDLVDHLIQVGAMRGVMRVLRGGHPNLAHQAMQFLEVSLRQLPDAVQAAEEESGAEALEQYEYHANRDLAAMAVTLLERYFYNIQEEME